jgi:hypothetical protein
MLAAEILIAFALLSSHRGVPTSNLSSARSLFIPQVSCDLDVIDLSPAGFHSPTPGARDRFFAFAVLALQMGFMVEKFGTGTVMVAASYAAHRIVSTHLSRANIRMLAQEIWKQPQQVARVRSK